MAETDENTAKAGLSFGFSKKLENKKLSKSVVGELDQKTEETDFVFSLEGKEVKSSKPQIAGKKTWVIPLIKENNWRSSSESKELKQDDREFVKERKGDVNVQSERDVKPSDDLNDQAAKEIIEAAALQNESWTTRGEPDPSLSVPLLMRNKVPEGFETDDRLDVSLRPEGPDDADYEQIPIDQFGFAMLRGMGWKDGEGIGKNKDLVAPLEAVLRPKGLGLGADRSLILQKKNGTVSHTGDKDEEGLALKRGAFCLVVKGKDKDLYGVVEGLDEDNARVMVKLTLSGKVITLSQYSVELVSKKDYEKFSKYLNKRKVDKFKEEQEKKNERKRRSRSRSRSPHEKSKKKKSHRKQSSSPDSDSRKSKRNRSRSPREKNRYKDNYNAKDSHQDRKQKDIDRSHKYDSERSKFTNGEPAEKKVKKEEYASRESSGDYLWVRANIKVRIVDKHYKNGKYYKAKVIIVDVVSHNNCICRTENGKVLEGLSQNVLETVVPKDDNACVFIVGGKHRGQVGQVVKRNKDTSQALVQLLSDRDTVVKLSYDDVCEYMGSLDDEFDY